MNSAGEHDNMFYHLQEVSVKRDKRLVLDCISLRMGSPSTIIIGANGGGKTTLLMTLAGLLPYAGKISLGTNEISSFPRKRMAQMVSFVPQLFTPYLSISVRDFILLGKFPNLNWMGQFDQKDKEDVDRILQRLEIDHLAAQSIGKTSGGELRKILLARAIAQNTPYILMDEPTQGLDPLQQQKFYGLVPLLLEENKKVIMVGHDTSAVRSGQFDVVAIRGGQIWFEGKPDKLPTNWIEDLYKPS
ncbi:MAG: ABC transporter ATP-binding protein [Bacteroidota bacterium]